jgi:peptidoglycan/xylan/chitin deacetylase (PgdA/CDA1 family)
LSLYGNKPREEGNPFLPFPLENNPVLKLLRSLLLLFIFAGIFFAAFVGFKTYLGARPEAALFAADSETATGAPDASTTGSTERTSIAAEYRRAEELARNAPRAAAGASSSTLTAASAEPISTPPLKKIVREWNTNRKLVALTYDDGPNTKLTPKFLELLKAENVRATFFLIGPNVKTHPELARQIAEAGFEVGNHSWTHPQFNRIGLEKVQDEVQKTSAEILAATGVEPAVLRPPYGEANQKVQDLIGDANLHIINWSIDSNDWKKGISAKDIADNAIKNIRDGSIILMHDRFDKSLEATEAIIKAGKEKGYQFVTVSELLGTRAIGDVPKPRPVVAASLPASNESAEDAPVQPNLELYNEASQDVEVTPTKPEGKLPTPGGGDANLRHDENHAAPAPSVNIARQQLLPNISDNRVTQIPATAR